MEHRLAPVVVLMGVSGTGKTTLGLLLAEETDGRFLDADDFHPPENILKMRSSQPLEDADRKEWLETLARRIRSQPRPESLFLACSALKERYRDKLRSAAPDRVRFVHLHGDPALIRQRLMRRAEDDAHFMPPSLLDSQLATLEPPDDAIAVDVTASPAEVAAIILEKLEWER